MQMRIASYILLFILVTLSSCRKVEYIVQEKTVIKDSIVYKAIKVPVQADSSSIQALLECDSLGKVYIKQITALSAGKNLQAPRVIIKDNYLTADCELDSFAVYSEYKKTHYLYRDNQVHEKEQPKTKNSFVQTIVWLIYASALGFWIIVTIFITKKIQLWHFRKL
jgi:hypothetical protein